MSSSLSLSDIHPMSSPTRAQPQSSPATEVLPAHEIAHMRAKALQMGLATAESTDATTTQRERDLLDMVLRLTNPNVPSMDPAQLVLQAETIAGLVSQRDYLTRQIEEERHRWESEREGWERMAEALIVQRNRGANGPDDSELRRTCKNLEFDNNALKGKLDHTQGRISALEAELSKLKPHLLMQPFVPRPTVVTTHRPAASSKQPLPTSPQQDPSIASQKPDTAAPAPAPKSVPDTAATLVPPASQAETEKGSENAPPPPPQPMGPEQGSPQEDIMVDVTSTMTEQQTRTVLRPPSLHALAQASSYFTSLPFPSLQNVITAVNRKKKLAAQLKKALQPAVGAAIQGKNEPKAGGFPMPPPGARTVLNASTQPPPPPPRRSRHGKARRTAPPQLVVSDARAEHLLIAARRIGRERAGIVAGVISAERERMEREKAEREQERVEREKERVEREKRNRGGGGYYRERPEQRETREEKRAESSSDRRYAHAMAGYVNAAGSSVKRDAHAAKGKGKSAPTAIDSLLSAARSMMDEGHDNSETGAEPPSASISSASTGMMTRRRAANASEPPQTEALPRKRRRLSSNTSHSPTRVRTALDVLADQAAVFSSSGKGKGKGLAEEIAASVEPTVKRKRGRPPNKDRDKIAPAKVSRLISPANAPASPPVAGPSRQGTANLGSTSVIHPRPATRWVQRGRQASSASARAPPRQKDDIESEDEEGEANAEKEQPEEMESRAEPELASKTGPDPVVKPASVIVDDAIPLIQSDAMTECEAPSLPPVIVEDLIVEDPVLDADADGESDPDVDMEGMGGGT